MKCRDQGETIKEKAAVVSMSLKAAFEFVRVRRIVVA